MEKTKVLHLIKNILNSFVYFIGVLFTVMFLIGFTIFLPMSYKLANNLSNKELESKLMKELDNKNYNKKYSINLESDGEWTGSKKMYEEYVFERKDSPIGNHSIKINKAI